MKKTSLFLIVLFLSFHLSFAQQVHQVHIIPEPVSIKMNEGRFQLNQNTRIIYLNKNLADVANILVKMLQTPTGYPLHSGKGQETQAGNTIYLKLNKRPNTTLDSGGYTLSVNKDRILVAANKPRGIFYGIQTLMQLLPPQIESAKPITSEEWDIPAVQIMDYPRFGWRGLMLDVSRHFFSKEFVESFIDEMAKYKYDVFHWHLSDDQGWRIEIKGLPKLTSVGAWRVPRTGNGNWGNYEAPQPGEKATYGGYYTQKDIREVIEYARKRFITVIPEIDVPAHSLALIASYPNLSCTKAQYSVNPGTAFYKKEDNVLCVNNDSTWLILDKIFTQIAQLFPSPYIHVGGDEAYKGFWKNCPRDQALMKKEGITSLEGLQSYFEKKLEKIILSKGKKMIGWDEILEGGLAPEAAVMSWRGMKGGTKAAKMGHKVVMSPWGKAYLDLYQGDPLAEPKTYGMLRLKTSYEWDPVPEGVNPKYILGGQGNLWTERVPNERHAEYMTWPRAMALAEVYWSPKDKKNWPDFVQRMEARFKYMDAAQVKYARSQYQAIITGVKDANNSLKVKLATQIPGLDIYYRFDGTDPDNFSPRYEGKPLTIPKGANEIRVITYRDGQPMSRQIVCPISVLEKRVKK